MKEDKRIVKTKRELKKTLAELLREKPFEQISVKEICDRSSTSRITCYTHYKDKCDLLNDLFKDFSDRVRESCGEMSDCGDPKNGLTAFLKKLLHGVVECVQENSFLIREIDAEKNSYLTFAFKCYISEAIESALRLLTQKFRCRYKSEEAFAFVRGGFVSLCVYAVGAHCSQTALEKKMVKLMQDVVESNILFVHE